MKRIARYSAAHNIPGFDFFLWLVLVKAKGAEGIVINLEHPKQHKFTVEEVLQRFENIIIPGPALADLPSWIGHETPNVTGTTEEFFRLMRPFERLRSVKEPQKVEYTVTLRNSYRVPGRNSSNAWKDFAWEIGAFVIEDYYDDPIHLHDRMAYYAGAKQNFLVNQGPTNLLMASPYPFCNFVTDANRRPYKKIGVLPDTRYSWLLSNQHFVWQNDSIENLREAFKQYG